MNRQPFYGIKLRVFLRKVLVQGIYKLLAADAVYNTSLFQRFHLGRRAANTVPVSYTHLIVIFQLSLRT